MRSFITASAYVAATAFAGSASYWKMGADWGETVPLCKEGREQSPIDLGNWAMQRDQKELAIDLSSYEKDQYQKALKADENGELPPVDYSWKVDVNENGGTLDLKNGEG